MGYSEDVAASLLENAADWKLEDLEQRLSQARRDYQSNVIDIQSLARTEREAVQLIGNDIKNGFENDESPQFFDLANVVTDRKTACHGYTQLFYIFGRTVGLSVSPIDVLEPCQGKVVDSHIACLVGLSDGRRIMVDLIPKGFVSETFDLDAHYSNDSGIWTLRDAKNPLRIHKKFRIWDEHGLVASICLSRGILCVQRGDEAEGIAQHTKAIEIDPTNSRNWYFRGLAYAILLENRRALADFDKAIELDPRDAKIYYGRGSLHIFRKEYSQAVADFTKVIELDGGNGKAFYKRGLANRSLGKDAEAEEDFAKAMDLTEMKNPVQEKPDTK